MITAVDTNVLLDLLAPDGDHADASRHALNMSATLGAMVISEVVYGELAAHFPSHDEMIGFLEDTGVRRHGSDVEALYLAGKLWRAYLERRPRSMACPSCGALQDLRCNECGDRLTTRQHLIADFMIGAHATIHADRLLTRDRGYFRTYFPDLLTA